MSNLFVWYFESDVLLTVHLLYLLKFLWDLASKIPEPNFLQALRVAGLAEMVAAFPKKLEHQITDEGQQQRCHHSAMYLMCYTATVWGHSQMQERQDTGSRLTTFQEVPLGLHVAFL